MLDRKFQTYNPIKCMANYLRKNAWNNGGDFSNPDLLWYAKGVGKMMSRSLDNLASITLLSRVVDFFRECSVAVGTMSGRSQQPRPDRFQDLLQRQTRSFFLPQGRWSG